ncbi:Ankyrin repeat and BTB/POZ domain-containing protein 1 [Pleodorina starrii]|nr:Ankyrin repeat and BTB/POZ domain-containing protein 1 [Pleodorina starrii]
MDPDHRPLKITCVLFLGYSERAFADAVATSSAAALSAPSAVAAAAVRPAAAAGCRGGGGSLPRHSPSCTARCAPHVHPWRAAPPVATAAAAAVEAAAARRPAVPPSVFLAHRSALASRSEYFRRLLDPAGGFADSGEAEVSLAEADPEAFGWLLAYMYTGELHMPYELLRPAADLAGRLLLPAECAADLQARLLAAVVTPGSVVSELIWAARHDMTDLVPQQVGLELPHQIRHVVLRRQISSETTDPGVTAASSRACRDTSASPLSAKPPAGSNSRRKYSLRAASADRCTRKALPPPPPPTRTVTMAAPLAVSSPPPPSTRSAPPAPIPPPS